MNMSKWRFGIEFETSMRMELAERITIGEYHDGAYLNKYWWVEDDGSLSGTYEYPATAEFVSDVLKYSEIEKAWKALEKETMERAGLKFHEAFLHNNTCGMHMHISHEFLPVGKMPIFVYTRLIRGRFFKYVRKEFPKNKAKSIIQHYFRSYAEKQLEIGVSLYDRYREFNFQRVEERGETRRIEWRSLNGYGLRTVEEFIKLTKIAVKAFVKSTYDFFKNRMGDVKYEIFVDKPAVESEMIPILINARW